MHALETCPSLVELERFLLGFGDAETTVEIEVHVSSCSKCGEVAGRFEVEDEMVIALRRAGAPDDTPEPASVESLVTVFRQAFGERDREATRTWGGWDAATGTLPGPALEPSALRAERAAEIGQLGAYQIREVLGAGGMGVVYRGYDPALRRSVAVKVIRKELLASAGALEMFLAEARAIAAVENDNIVIVHAVEVHDGVPCIIMPLLKGQTLAESLKASQAVWPAERIVRLAVDCLNGLAAAHGRGLIHRDIKPGNLWVEGDGRVKILDFGLSTAAGSGAGKCGGTPGFMAPEQIRGGATDARADLFSLGCVLYLASTRHGPFEGENATAALVKTIMREPPPVRRINPALPSRLANLIDRLLAKSPVDRPESAVAVLAELAEMAAESAARRHKIVRRRWLGGLAVAMVVGGFGVWAFARPNPVLVPIVAPEQPPVTVDVEFDPDLSKLVATRNGREQIVELPRDAKVSLVPGEYTLRLAKDVPGRTLEPSSFIVLPGEPRTLKLSLVGEVAQTKLHDGSVTGIVTFAGKDKDSLVVLSASLDRTLNAWAIGTEVTPQLARLNSPARAFAATPDGKVLATAGGNKQLPFDLGVQLWNGETLTALGDPLEGHTRSVNALAISRDGSRVISASMGEVWLRTLNRQRREELVGHGEGKVTTAAFDAVGKRAITGDDAGYLILWDTGSAQPIKKIVAQAIGEVGAVRVAAFTPTGFLSSGDDGVIRIWELPSFKTRELSPQAKPILALAVSSDGTRFLSGGADGIVKLWSATDGTVLAKLEGHRGAVNAVAFTPDGRGAVSGGADRTVRLWRLPRP